MTSITRQKQTRMSSLIGNPVAEIRAIPRHDHKTRDLAVGFFRDERDFGDTAVRIGTGDGKQ